MTDGSPGVHVSGDVAAGWCKWECKAQQVQRGLWEDTAPAYSLHSQSPSSWHADLEGHTLPTCYKGTGMHPSLFFPLTTTPLFGVLVSPSPVTLSIIVMSTTSRISSNGAMLSKLASFLSIGWTSSRMSMGNLGRMRGSMI